MKEKVNIEMHPKVQTKSGELRGVEEGGVWAFRGIPYAASTEASGRFRAPQEVKPWVGVREATRAGPAAVQPTRLPPSLRRLSAVPPNGVSEDCLNLNVWTPGLAASARPVMVWLHGGGFTRGSGSWYLYSGARMALRGDVVVVSINYRLGAFGALVTEEMADSDSADSNVGLRDQIAALRWVAENIADFGGDPTRVTAFGQSAGAMSVASLLATPAAKGLFSRAILQSGAASNLLRPSQGRDVARDLCARLGVDIQSAHPLAELRTRDASEILEAQMKVSDHHHLPLGAMAWQPTLDGELFTDTPLGLWPGLGNPAPEILLGTNLDEWKMFTALDGKRRNLDEATLRDYLGRTLASDEDLSGSGSVDEVLALYAKTPEGHVRTPGQIWSSVQGDRVFTVPAVQLADRNAELKGKTWLYRFDWKPRWMHERVGACHSMELPFVFGSLREPLPRWLLQARQEDQHLSDQIQEAWFTFAKSGDPRSEANPSWPLYQDSQGKAHVFGGRDRDVSALPEEERRFWSDRDGPN
ncbi:MAG: carboxylesterase family protein [Myxococcota bacterium]|nr:carboxylesterase family protein [Myxococcota bacterium]